MSSPGVLRRGRRAFAERELEWHELYAGERAFHLLHLDDELNAGDGRERVYAVLGPALRTLGACREWLQGAGLPEGWRGDGHYLRPPAPVFRFVHDDGRRVTVLRAAAWWGEGDYTADTAAGAWARLGELIRGHFDEGRLLLTPATTGRYLLLRSVAYGREWPALADELQELIRSTSGQGRIQHFARPELEGPVDLFAYDARLAYVACCTELGAGVPERDTVNEYAGHRRGRYRVRATVPADWAAACRCGASGHPRIGILPNATNRGGWEYPAEPRRTFDAWVDGAELRVALEHGWRVEVLERILYPWPPYPPLARKSGQTSKRGPLDVWGSKLAMLRAYTERDDAMVANALRMIVLTGIGALQGRGHRTTHAVHINDAASVPADVDDVERVEDWLVYEEGADDAARWAAMSHPEWAAAIWGRARARLLDAPGWTRQQRTGALHVPAESIVAFRTDAVWLVNDDPRWRDDGRLGRYRRAAHLAGVAYPNTALELDARRKETQP